MEKKFQSMSHHDLDLGLTMPNIELGYNVFIFHVPRSISFRVIAPKHTDTETHTRTQTHTKTLTSTL